MRLNRVADIYRKELLETVRDRRTLVVMLVVPMVLYPLLAILGVQAAVFFQSKLQEETLLVAAPRVVEAADFFDEFLSRAEENGVEINPIDRDAAEPLILDGTVAAGFFLTDTSNIQQKLDEGTLPIEIVYDSGNIKSAQAYERLRSVLREIDSEVVRARLEARDLAETLATPFELNSEDIASPTRKGAFLLGGLISFLLITMALSGAFHSAVDLTAGEKERGTLETLLVAPVRRREVILGKYCTVLSVAVATSILNLTCMGLTFSSLAGGFLANQQIEFAVGPRVLVGMLITLLPLAALFSAVTIGTSSYARSFKEGQNYLLPVFMVVMFPALLPVIPGIEFNSGIAVVPVAGPALLFRALLMEEANAKDVFLVFATTILYAGVALAWTTSIYRREDVLFRSESNTGSLITRPTEGSATPTRSAAVGLFFVLFALYAYLGLNASAESSLLRTLVAPQFVFLLGPLAAIIWWRNRMSATLSWRMPTLRSLLAVPLITTGGMGCALVVQSLVLQGLEPPAALEEFIRNLLASTGPWLSIIAIAALPAVCEEVFCRGYLLSGLRSQGGTIAAIVVSGILFGVLHLEAARIPATAFLGIVLAIVVVRSGSIVPAMLIHFANNSTQLVLSDQYREAFPDSALNGAGGATARFLEAQSTTAVGFVGLLLLVAGLALLSSRRDAPSSSPAGN